MLVTCKDCCAELTATEVYEYGTRCTICWAYNFLLRAHYHVILQDRHCETSDAHQVWDALAEARRQLMPMIKKRIFAERQQK